MLCSLYLDIYFPPQLTKCWSFKHYSIFSVKRRVVIFSIGTSEPLAGETEHIILESAQCVLVSSHLKYELLYFIFFVGIVIWRKDHKHKGPKLWTPKTCFVCLTQLNKHWIIGKTSPQILWLQFTIHKVWRFSTCSLQNKQSWLICKAFHYCRKPSLSRLGSSFPFIVAYSECFNDPITLTLFRKDLVGGGAGLVCTDWLVTWWEDWFNSIKAPEDKEMSSQQCWDARHVSLSPGWGWGVEWTHPRTGDEMGGGSN